MPKPFLELWLEYQEVENPVTRWVLQQCVVDKVERDDMHAAVFYLHNLSREE